MGCCSQKKVRGIFLLKKTKKKLDKSVKMCGRFQHGFAENGPCNEKRSQFITRRMHNELPSRKTEKAIKNNDPEYGTEQR